MNTHYSIKMVCTFMILGWVMLAYPAFGYALSFREEWKRMLYVCALMMGSLFILLACIVPTFASQASWL